MLASFYDWTIEEGLRDTISPARQVRRARTRKPAIFRPTREEVLRLLAASQASRRERWVIHLGVLAGLRRQELCGLQGRHFARPGWIWVSEDIGKRRKERWVPVLPELEQVAAEIAAAVGLADYVIPSLGRGNPLVVPRTERRDTPISGSGLYRLVKRVGGRAQLGHEIGPHTLRHAFGDHVARYAGLKAAQALLGHESVATTEGSYTGRIGLDELAASVRGFTYNDTQQEK